MRLLIITILFVLACSTLPAREATRISRGHPAAMDSIVLERTNCFLGPCPAYRLRVTGRGAVAFLSRNPGESLSANDTVPTWVPDSLTAQAHSSGFFILPDSIVADAPICQDYGTDNEAISVTIFGTRTKHVYFDTGCSSRTDPSVTQTLQAFRNLADSIDSLTGAKRWIRPRVLR